MKKITFLITVLFAFYCYLSAEGTSFALRQKVEKTIENHVPLQADQLSLREQVGQTIMPRVFVGQQADFKESVLNGEVTGFFVKSHLPFDAKFLEENTPAQIQQRFKEERAQLIQTIRDLQTWAQQSRHQIPLLFAIDYEGGQVTSPMYMGLKQMPSNMLLGASQDESIITAAYDAQAKELLQVGANVSFGPVTDVNSNPNNPIIQARSFGGNAKDVGRKAALAVLALQANRVPAFNKHFPGHGDTETDTHVGQTFMNLSWEDLWAQHVSAFMPSIRAGVKGVMSAHVTYKALDEGSNGSLSPRVIKKLLQKKMGFKGVVATDGLDMGAMGKMTVEDMVLHAYKAGNHLLLLTSTVDNPKDAPMYARKAGDFVEQNIQAVESGKRSPKGNLSRKEIRNAAQKIIELKQWMGLFDGNKPAVAGDTGFEKMARRAALEGVTVVRDSQHLIPVTKKKQNVCSVFFALPVFQEQLGKFNTYLASKGKHVETVFAPVKMDAKEADAYQQQIQACMQGADLVVLGTSGSPKKEAFPDQYALASQILNQAEQTGKQAVLLSLVSPYDIPLYPQAKTVLALYGPTADTAEVAAQILMGQVKAKGVLPVDLK